MEFSGFSDWGFSSALLDYHLAKDKYVRPTFKSKPKAVPVINLDLLRGPFWETMIESYCL